MRCSRSCWWSGRRTDAWRRRWRCGGRSYWLLEAGRRRTAIVVRVGLHGRRRDTGVDLEISHGVQSGERARGRAQQVKGIHVDHHPSTERSLLSTWNTAHNTYHSMDDLMQEVWKLWKQCQTLDRVVRTTCEYWLCSSPITANSIIVTINGNREPNTEASWVKSRPSSIREEVPTDLRLAANGRVKAEQLTIDSLRVCDTDGSHDYHSGWPRSSKMNWYRIYYGITLFDNNALLLTDPSDLINWPDMPCFAWLYQLLVVAAINGTATVIKTFVLLG